MDKLTIVKVGGAVVEDQAQLEQLLQHFTAIPGHKVLVHGGGRRATQVAARLGIESKMVNGRRITDSEMLGGGTMVYGGLVNKNLVARLQAAGVNALGLTGADMNVLRSRKRKPVTLQVREEKSEDTRTCTVDFGYVGDVEQADGKRLQALILQGITPIMAPLTHDGEGHILNTNADTIAAETAKALAPYFDVTLVYSFEKPGVLRDANDDQSVIPLITRDDFARYVADGTVSGGMIPKIENALNATAAGVKKVVITLATAIDGTQGTTIQENQ